MPGSRVAACGLLVAAVAAGAVTVDAGATPASGGRSARHGIAEFTDEDLDDALASDGRGVIYLWSPHMPFSVDGIEAIRTAADQRDLAVTLVLHPGSDRAFARRALEDADFVGLDADTRADALRALAAKALIERGMTNHAPSIQLYREGELIGPVLPGVRSIDGYLEFIDSFAHEAAR